MPDQSDRLSFYQALFSMLKIDELDEIKDEMIDKFGRLPVIINRFNFNCGIKILCFICSI